MNDDELGRLLSGAFDAQARSEVGDTTPAPPPRFASRSARHRRPRRHRSIRVLAPLTAAAAVIAVVAIVLGVSDSPSDHRTTVAGGSATKTTVTSAPATPSTQRPQAPAKPVHVKLLNSDGSTYGVGMPVIAFFSKKIKSAKEFQAKTTATVNGKAVHGAWYFESSAAQKGYPIEAHFRLQNYWPAHAKIHIGMPVKGAPAGTGFAFDNNLTLDFTTGPRNVSTVDDATHRITVTSDGKTFGTFPVSLGASNTPTRHGTKVIMEKGASICMHGPGYNECGVKDTQRLTYDGEYLHAAPWNVANIHHGVDSSNGCTNLLPGDAKTLYDKLNIGDVVMYPNAKGGQMQLGLGYGDWNVPWGAWQTGGLVPTS